MVDILCANARIYILPYTNKKLACVCKENIEVVRTCLIVRLEIRPEIYQLRDDSGTDTEIRISLSAVSF